MYQELQHVQIILVETQALLRGLIHLTIDHDRPIEGQTGFQLAQVLGSVLNQINTALTNMPPVDGV